MSKVEKLGSYFTLQPILQAIDNIEPVHKV